MRAVAVRAVREALVAARTEFIVVCSLARTQLKGGWSYMIFPAQGEGVVVDADRWMMTDV